MMKIKTGNYDNRKMSKKDEISAAIPKGWRRVGVGFIEEGDKSWVASGDPSKRPSCFEKVRKGISVEKVYVKTYTCVIRKYGEMSAQCS